MLKKELNIFTFGDLLEWYPIRYLDKTKVSLISDINFQTEYTQFVAKLIFWEEINTKGRRLIAQVADSTGMVDLVWFNSITAFKKILQEGATYLVYGKVTFFNARPQIIHPEIELFTPEKKSTPSYLEPVYSSTEKLSARGLNGRQIGKLTANLLAQLHTKDVPENIPYAILTAQGLMPRYDACCKIHFPTSQQDYEAAVRRLKFEELFIAQVRLNRIRMQRRKVGRGVYFTKVGTLFNTFYNKYLPFELTNAQKRVLKEIRTDTASGYQMNRLLQGDVGSGKTIVALLTMLIALDNGFQSCLMAPTEILAQQHFTSLQALLNDMPIRVGLLTGSVKGKARAHLLHDLAEGNIHFVVGTHALIEQKVVFKNIGLAVVDEQHRFGVAQRAKLLEKVVAPPHVLVMTATPIPRTLAMTLYGDLDCSIMDELPPGRQEIITVHRTELARESIMSFVRTELEKGRQAYIVYPLIEESETMDYENLMRGYDVVKCFFPEPKYYISMVHGKQPADVKATNMQRFVSGDTQIMVSTTVIEVGVNVPNASVMIIESAEKFGLAQLHQLRGRVGRGSEKSFCILLTGSKGSQESKERMKIMCATTNGFIIAEKDLMLRGPGDIEGTKQSGVLNFKLASITTDRDLLEIAKTEAEKIVQTDIDFVLPQHNRLKQFLQSQKHKTGWGRIA